MFVFEAPPLIYLAKVDRLEVVDALDGDCLIPKRVYGEVVTEGVEGGYPDARRIEHAVEAGHFEVRTIKETTLYERLHRNPNLSDADVAVLALVDETNGIAVMDERYGRDVAETEGIETRGTAYLLLSLVRDDVISTEEAQNTIDEMIDAGWYCAPDVYSRIVRELHSNS